MYATQQPKPPRHIAERLADYKLDDSLLPFVAREIPLDWREITNPYASTERDSLSRAIASLRGESFGQRPCDAVPFKLLVPEYGGLSLLRLRRELNTITAF